MSFHKEGRIIVLVSVLLLTLPALASWLLGAPDWLTVILGVAGLIMLCLVIQFFRVPKRKVSAKDNQVICPADGKVVVIEETEETEYFKDKRVQVSIFMSPLNVHVNWNPISGVVKYFKYHPGKFLVAWHPKSSTDNERTTLVIKDPSGREVLVRQIAGAVARRICHYADKNDQVEQGEQFGFIKFGSRVDIFLPLGTDIKVAIDDKVQGINTILAELR
ncbi:MAG: phosphatidylserine decarboxylase family protein [Flavobacteriales bacterium]